MPFPTKHGQRGIALLLFLFLAISIGATVFLSTWNSTRARQEQERNSAMALQQAKESLIGDAAANSDINSAGYLRLPDLGRSNEGESQEGLAAINFIENDQNHSVIGKLPWNTLGIPPLYDQHGECLWYIVSGRFKKTPKTEPFNWDTQGQIDIIDGSGTLIASNIAAMVVAPGSPLDGQSRAQSDPVYSQCGGNYVASNYLDPGDVANAIAGQVNYFAGSINGRVASNDGNKRFVMASGPHFNDRFLWITVDDIFRPIIQRNDFSIQINSFISSEDIRNQVNNLSFWVNSGPKGTDNLNCDMISDQSNKKFCKNWKEMFFITQLPSPTPTCSRVIIFAGQKTSGQTRMTPANKQDKRNYLEGRNLDAFDTPTALSNDFDFDNPPAFVPSQPWKDIVRCIAESP